MPRATGVWDVVDPHVLLANASARFSAIAFMESLTPLVEAASLMLGDAEVSMPPGVIVTKRWTLEA